MPIMSESARIILITGASSGIGRACAQRLLAQGHRVFGTFRSPPSSGHLEGLEAVRMDVTDDASVHEGVSAVLNAAARIDVVVNNAGYGLAGSVEDSSLEEVRRQFDTNVFGVLRVCQAVLPQMRERGDGLIVNIGSLGGLFGLPFQGVYSGSKFALEGITEAMRHEVAPFGVRVTLVEPGDIATGITDNRVRAEAAGGGSVYADAFARALRTIENDERGGPSPEIVAELVARLVSVRAPRQRYAVGRFVQRSSAWAKRLLPEPLFERIIRSYFGL
jgi:NAD(P)-dependent dehydrogenase (short-subunit alcohol dehydrogenase family)